MDESQVADGGAAQLRILLRLRGLQELGRVAREKECLQDFPADVRGSFRLVQLLQFARAVDQAELTDGFAAQRLVLFTLGRGEKTLRSEEHTSELQSLRHLVC